MLRIICFKWTCCFLLNAVIANKTRIGLRSVKLFFRELIFGTVRSEDRDICASWVNEFNEDDLVWLIFRWNFEVRSKVSFPITFSASRFRVLSYSCNKVLTQQRVRKPKYLSWQTKNKHLHQASLHSIAWGYHTLPHSCKHYALGYFQNDCDRLA